MTKLICITGARHIGKTTVLETLIPAIIHSGYTVAAVKYSTHAHELDTPGKNSWRLKQAGAEVTAMVTPKEIAEYIYFICSNKNTQISKQILTISGGE